MPPTFAIPLRGYPWQRFPYSPLYQVSITNWDVGISNCGRDIIKGSAPASKIKLAYYESWNFNRREPSYLNVIFSTH